MPGMALVCIWSSGDYAVVGNAVWWHRMTQAMEAACIDGMPIAKIHGLRMLNPDVFCHLPLSSADSTNIGRNVGIDQAWKGTNFPTDQRSESQRDEKKDRARQRSSAMERVPRSHA